ncbi:hypothetical protein [uncultured Sphingomonas sp.]|uniref:hypothetical protein n=1 Tax=uncultured Sphingomonas sp. TaxID=158754 RepID=UPI0030F4FCFC
MAKTCAYCDALPPLTREHIWPNGFLKRGNFGVKFSAKANKTFAGDLTISDVCPKCNNGPLSTLDAHACELFDRRFSKFVEAGASVPFTYDYGLLMRWLLKVSFNAARLTGQDVALLSRYRETILADHPCSPAFVAVYVATISPSHMIDSENGTSRKIYPHAARCGPLEIPAIDVSDILVTRCVMINSFMFSLLITRSSGIPTGRVAELLRHIPGVPLALGGRMRIGPPSLPAHVALGGVTAWPKMESRR